MEPMNSIEARELKRRLANREYNQAELNAFTAMRQYHDCISRRLFMVGRDRVVRQLPIYKDFPEKVGTNEKLLEWAKASARLANPAELCRHMFDGVNNRAFNCQSNGAAGYASVCAIFYYILNQGIISVKVEGDAQLGCDTIRFETEKFYCRIKYNSNLTAGFLNIDVIYKHNIPHRGGIYDARR